MMRQHFIITAITVVTIAALSSCHSTVKDIDANRYKTVIIGEQEWMSENLRTTRLNDGTPIEMITDTRAWSEATEPAWSWYGNEEDNYSPYGALYNWHAVNTQKLCPPGWKVPAREDWDQLINYLGGDTTAGGYLKSTATDPHDIHPRWDNPNEGATNESKFSALPGGMRIRNGAFHSIGIGAFWWSSTEYDETTARYIAAGFAGTRILTTYDRKVNGFSVRCVRGS